MGLPRNAIAECQNNEIRQPRQLMANINIQTSISPIELQMVIVSRGILCSKIFFPKNRTVYGIMWENMAQPDRQQVTI